MSRPAKQAVMACHYFKWIIFQRPTGIWYADGRGNRSGLKRYSLGTLDRTQAIETLKNLDAKMAVQVGKAPASVVNTTTLLSIQEGVDAYTAHARRTRILGGVRPATLKRYRTIFAKFSDFAVQHHITGWQQVTKSVLEEYGQWLEDSDYAYATQYIELATLNQAIKYLALVKKLLPAECYQPLGLSKSDAVTRYCYTREQVEAMITRCVNDPTLRWLGHVIVALATTGLRISELASIRWNDIDLANNNLKLPDTSRSGTREQRASARTTKGGYTRAFPIHRDFRVVLEQLPHHTDARVFHGPLGGLLKPDSVRVIFIRDVIKPLKTQFPDPPEEPGFSTARLHSFRHYFCSAAADAGTPDQMLMAWLGHKASRMVKHYYHLRETSSQASMTKLNLVGSAAALLRQPDPLNPETPKSDVNA